MNSDVVGRFASQLIRSVAGFLFLAARKIDQDHVHARFQQMRIKCESFIECFLGAGMIARFAEPFYDPIRIGAAERRKRQGE